MCVCVYVWNDWMIEWIKRENETRKWYQKKKKSDFFFWWTINQSSFHVVASNIWNEFIQLKWMIQYDFGSFWLGNNNNNNNLIKYCKWTNLSSYFNRDSVVCVCVFVWSQHLSTQSKCVHIWFVICVCVCVWVQVSDSFG